MTILPPLILPGGGRFKANPSGPGGLLVSIRHQGPCLPSGDELILHWRFSMSPPGRMNADNGPVIEGRIPARPETPFEEGYQFSIGKIGYRKSIGGLDFNIPGIYKVYAWVESGVTGEKSRTQYCVFEIVGSGVSSAMPHLGA